jgi:hydrogenase maturation protease
VLRIEGSDLVKGTDTHTLVSVHDLTITDVLRIGEHVQSLPEIVVIGIEIGELATEFSRDISPEVLKAVDEAIKLIREEISELI